MAGVFGACLGLGFGILAAVVLIDPAPAASVVFWLVWAGCMGFLLGAAATIFYAIYVVRTIDQTADPDFVVNIYTNSILAGGIPSFGTALSAAFWCWAASLLLRPHRWRPLLVGIATGFTLLSLLVLEFNSRYMLFYKNPELSTYGVDHVMHFLEGKLHFSPTEPGFTQYPSEPVIALLALPATIGIAAAFIQYYMARSEGPERRSG